MQGSPMLKDKRSNVALLRHGFGRAGLTRFSARHLLAALVLLLVVSPFLEPLRHGNLIETSLFMLVLLCALLAVGGRRRDLLAAMVLLIPTFITRWISFHHPEVLRPEIFRLLAILFLGFIVSRLLGYILRAPRVNSEVLYVAISVYLMIGVMWALAYMIAAEWVPGSFTFSSVPPPAMAGFQAVYFSFVTLSTVGYGDIVPASNLAKMLAIMEATTGLFYVAILISRLVALYAPGEANVPGDSTTP